MKCFFAVLCFVLISAVVAQDVCRGIRGQAFIGDPENCHGWVRCTREMPDWCGICEWGMVFDSEQGGCNYETAQCGDRPMEPEAAGAQHAECAGLSIPAEAPNRFIPAVLAPKRV